MSDRKAIARKYYYTHHEIVLERRRHYYEKGKHPCLDCGKIININAIRCHRCANVFMGKQRAKPLNRCLDCGRVISKKGYRCVSCSLKDRWRRGVYKPHIFLPREKHPSWKGGKHKDNAGYIYILKPEHPRAHKDGYVPEHIWAWEQSNGKPLPNGWHVHHLNGVKDDNRPANLVALPSKKHFFVLQAKAKRIQELEALLNNQAQLL